MYARTKNKPQKTSIKLNNTVEGERLETKVERMTTNKEPIKDTAALIYTERKDGVNPEHDIRTDRWEHAVEGMGKVAKMRLAERDKRHAVKPDNPDKPADGNTGNEGKA